MPFRPQRVRDQVGAPLRVRRHVDDLHPRDLEQFAVISTHMGVREKLLCPQPRLLHVAIAEGHDLEPEVSIRAQVALADTATPDQSDPRSWRAQGRGRDVQIGHRELNFARALTDPVPLAGLAHPMSSTVRPSAALATAESTICCPMRANDGESGPSIGASVSMQWIMY